jgi:DNA mismatch repair ATPase MutS
MAIKQVGIDFFAIALFESTTGKVSVNQVELSELSTVIVRDQPREILVEEVYPSNCHSIFTRNFRQISWEG